MSAAMFTSPLPLPGLQRDRALLSDDRAPERLREAASRSLRRSASAARALADGAPLVRRALDEESGLGDMAWPHGRFPAAFAEPTAVPFEKAVVRACRDDQAFAQLVAPLIAASTLQHPREHRAVLSASWPTELQALVREAFEWLRAKEARLDDSRSLPPAVLTVAACASGTSLRPACASAVASVFGLWWSEELYVLDPSSAWLGVRWSRDEDQASRIAAWWMTTEPLW